MKTLIFENLLRWWIRALQNFPRNNRWRDPEQFNAWQREYRRTRTQIDPDFAERHREHSRKSAREHREERNQKEKIKRATDLRVRLTVRLRNRIGAAVEGRAQKSAATMLLLGCTIDQFLGHLEIQFQDGMSWDNYGDWHIDHKRPCASFDLTDPEQQRQCFRYSNQQPLWAQENLSKGSKIQTIS